MEQVSEDFGEKITQRDRTIRSLETDIRKLEEGIQKLNLDIEEKGNEILKVRSDANKKLRFEAIPAEIFNCLQFHEDGMR